MLCSLLKYTAPLVLLFALLFLTGAASAVDSLAGKTKADLCCASEAEEREPKPATQCSETDCRCLSCCVPLFIENDLPSSCEGAAYPPTAWGWFVPSVPVVSIDYPPEFS